MTTSNLPPLTAGTLLKCGRNVTTSPHYHTGIAEIRACFNGYAPPAYTREGTLITNDTNPDGHKIQNSTPSHNTPPKEPTGKQIKYYTDLVTYLHLPNNIFDFHAGNISEELTRLKAIRSNLTPAERAHLNATPSAFGARPTSNLAPFPTPVNDTHARPHLPRIEVTEGLWVLDNDPKKIFKVQVAIHGSGFLYVKQFNIHTQRFQKLNGGMRTLSMYLNATPSRIRPLTPKEAAEFGALYGMCVACSRTLTDEVSISDGYGPICADKYGWPRNRNDI